MTQHFPTNFTSGRCSLLRTLQIFVYRLIADYNLFDFHYDNFTSEKLCLSLLPSVKYAYMFLLAQFCLSPTRIVLLVVENFRLIVDILHVTIAVWRELSQGVRQDTNKRYCCKYIYYCSFTNTLSIQITLEPEYWNLICCRDTLQ